MRKETLVGVGLVALNMTFSRRNLQISLAIVAVVFPLAWTDAGADTARGAFSFSSASNCAASGKLPAELCATAEANAAAEFEEKAPRFPSRALCERIFGGCALGFRGADGWAGKKNAVYFSPRQNGFRITVKSDHDTTVVPLGQGLNFSPRSALRRDASINPRAGRAQTGAGFSAGAGQPGGFGVPTAEGGGGPLPPRPPVDPNFDCAAVLEPSDKGDASTGCVLAPANRR